MWNGCQFLWNKVNMENDTYSLMTMLGKNPAVIFLISAPLQAISFMSGEHLQPVRCSSTQYPMISDSAGDSPRVQFTKIHITNMINRISYTILCGNLHFPTPNNIRFVANFPIDRANPTLSPICASSSSSQSSVSLLERPLSNQSPTRPFFPRENRSLEKKERKWNSVIKDTFSGFQKKIRPLLECCRAYLSI